MKYLLVLTFLLSTAYAEEPRVEVNSRELSEAEKQEIENFEKKELQEAPETKKSQIPVIHGNAYPPVLFENDTHNIVGVSALGDYIVLEDGSQWKIKPGYNDEAYLWKELDPILLITNDFFLSSWFSNYKYKLVNARTNTFIEVQLQLGPILDNPNTLFVVGLNPITYEVLLSDDSCWRVDPAQYYIFNKWLINDVVIVGKTKLGWRNSPYENILLNVNMYKNVRSQRLE